MPYTRSEGEGLRPQISIARFKIAVYRNDGDCLEYENCSRPTTTGNLTNFRQEDGTEVIIPLFEVKMILVQEQGKENGE